jgi:hypothetical protein
MNQQSAKCQWRIEKPLTFTGRFGYEKYNNLSTVLFHGVLGDRFMVCASTVLKTMG